MWNFRFTPGGWPWGQRCLPAGLGAVTRWCRSPRCQQRPSSQQCLPHTVLKSWWPIPTSVFPPTFHWTPQKMSQCRKRFGWARGGQRQNGVVFGTLLALSSLWESCVFKSVGEKGQSIPSSRGHSLQTRSHSQKSHRASRDEEGQVGKGQSSSRHGPCAAPEPRAHSLAAAQPRSPVTGCSPSSFLHCQSSPVTGTQLPKLNETKIT